MKTKKIKYRGKPHKPLVQILKKHSGRDNTGTVSVRHQGKRQKRFYRKVDFKHDKLNMKAKVINIEYDPNRTANIALIEYEDKQKRYIICPDGLTIGQEIEVSEKTDLNIGNALTLKHIPVGMEIYNIELYPGQGAQLIKSAGSSAVILAKDDKYAHVKLPSKQIRKIQLNCYATIGKVSNVDHKLEVIGKAGRKRLMGIRPSVRGVAQNPRSHPHGGGEGRSGQGMHSKTKWGKSAHGTKTRKKRRSQKFIISKI